MKLALKVTSALVLGIVLVMGAFAFWRVERLIELFDADMRKNHVLIGSTLAVPVLDAWSREGAERAAAVVQLADADRHGMHIGWLPAETSGSGRQSLTGTPPPVTIEHHVARLGGDLSDLHASDAGTPHLVTYVPVSGPQGPIGVLELATSYESRDRYVRTSIISSVISGLVMSAVAAGLVLLLGVWLIGRPLARLTEKARLIGSGDPGEPLDMRQNDEIGFLAREMNAMCDRLEAANSKAEAEAAARARAQDELKHADRLITVGKIAAGIAHELGTPLNIVSGRAKMIVRGKIEGPAVVEYARSIADQADRMTSAIQQLLDFSRRREPQKHSVDLAAAIHCCVDLLRHMAAKRGIALVVEPQDEDIRAHADPGQLDQITTNLVVNALQASGGGTTVRIKTGRSSHPAKCASRVASDRFAFISVSDQGTGMTEHVKQRVFEPFFSTKSVGQGVGLGLSVVSDIVEEHGGWVEVQSEVGLGSTFSVYLPEAS